MYQFLLFDLDGTLTDPGLGITNSVRYALNKFHIEEPDRTALYRFIGPPLLDSFMEFYGFSREQSDLAIQYYREYFKVKGLYENQVYDGIPELLTALKERGRTLLLATSKPEEYAVEILKHFHLDHYFDFVAGATMDGSRSKKADVIAHALDLGKISRLSSAVMIGDREHDILGAGQMGLDSIGVLYGYGSEAELRAAGATYIAKDPAGLLSLI